MAQEIEEEPETKSKPEFTNYWDEHFRTSLGTSYAYGLDQRSYRAYSYTSLAWTDHFGDFYFNIEALAFRRDYQYSLELSPDDSEELTKDIQALDNRITMTMDTSIRNPDVVCAGLSPNPVSEQERRLTGLCDDRRERQGRLNFNLNLQDNALLWPEANIKYKIGDIAELLAGYHTIVWGQLDFLSPVDFILPLRLGSTGLGISKADNRNPQLMSLLSIFPKPWLEVQAYFFPDLGIDNAFIDNIRQESEDNQSDYRNVARLELPKGQDQFRYALRTLFYLDEITFGLIYYRGFFQFDAKSNLILSETRDASAPTKQIYRIDGKPELPPIEAFGFESALPTGKWIWKLDLVHFTIPEDLSLDVELYNNQIIGYLPKDKFFDKRTEYVRWLLEQNNGKLEIVNNVTIATGGVDADLDHWMLNLGVALFYFDRSSNDDRGQKLYTEAEDIDDMGFSSDEFFAAPIINAVYFIDDEKKDGFGLAMGFLNTGFGVILYASQEYFESLRVALSLEYLVLFSNGIVNVEGYQLEDPAYPAIRFIVDYI